MREMKDSGIEWVGKIPKGWSICPLYMLFSERKNRNSKGQEINLLSLSYGRIIRKNININTGLLPESFNTYNIVEKDDIIIRPTDLQNDKRSLRTGIVKEHGIITSAYIALKPKKYTNSSYFHYLLHAYDIKKVFYNMGNGVRQGLNYSEFCKLLIINPTNQEQSKIINFLDAKCADIDSLTADIQKQIDILKEYKKSVITQAVTKGLDPNVEMKDSGIAWIGKIPKHWIYPKLTYILDTEHEYPIGDGDHGTIKANDYVQEGIPFIRVQNLGFATPLRLDDVVYITKKQNITIKNSTLKPDDILFAKTGATIGKVGIVPKELLISNTTSHVGKITVNQKIIIPRFLFYALSSTVGYKLLWDIAGQKSTRPELSIEEIKRLHIILPDSLQEQQTIVDYLDAKCANIDAAIAGKQKQLDVLKEYKKSLIYEYVTGKKEVPCRE